MNYVPTDKELNKLIVDLSKIEFFEWATRPMGFHIWEINQHSYYKYYPDFIEKKFKFVLLVSEKTHEVMYRNKKQHQEFIRNLQTKLKNYKFLIDTENKIERSYIKLWRLIKTLSSKNWNKISNKKLSEWFSNYHESYAYMIAGISTGILISEAMANHLKKELMRLNPRIEGVDLIVRELSMPEQLSMTGQEELALLKVMQLRKNKNFSSLLKKHAEKWAYIPVYTQFSPWTLDDFRKRVADIKKTNLHKRYLELATYRQRVLERKREIFKNYKINKEIEQISSLLPKYLFWRINDETTFGLVTYSTQPFFREVAKRLFISERQLLHMLGPEVIRGLNKGKVNVDEINRRISKFAFILNPKGVAVLSGAALAKVLKAVALTKKSKVSQNNKILHGVPANPGLVRGKAKVVLTPTVIGKVKKGDILVTTQTTPAYVIAMKIAGAIIAEDGGITSHAAIVSRELGTPCVIGVSQATRLLKDGDLVEVDANKGIVRKL